MDQGKSQTTELDAFLTAFHADWIKAGQPSASVTVAMVREIERLRAALANEHEGIIRELARGIQIAHRAWVQMGRRESGVKISHER